MNIGNQVKLVSDVSIELLPLQPAVSSIDVSTHINQSADDVQTYFSQNGLSGIKFNKRQKSGTGNNVSVYSCFINGKGSYTKLSQVLSQMLSRYPQMKIKKLYIYSKNQKAITKSTLTFELTFDFHQSNI